MSRSCLTEKIQEKILLRLPVKSILRFKSVCKNWYALISSRKFIKDHLNLSATKNRKIMLGVSEDDDIFYSIDYASLLSPTLSMCDRAVLMDHPNDNNANDNMYSIIGSCNGLILLLAELSQTLYLWNPSTREYRKIIGAPKAIENLAYGFGYDPKTDNYKLVCIATGFSDDHDNLEDFSEIYTYTDGSWSKGQNIPYSCYDETEAVLLNGVLHWLGETVHCTGAAQEETIICFDINSEKFMSLPFPNRTMTCREQSLHLQSLHLQLLRDSLCLVSSVRKARVDIWVMQNYGVRESWTKEFTITQEIITANPSSLKCYGFAKNGEILIQFDDCFGLYDRKNNSLRILNLNGTMDGYSFSESYVESLVSVTNTMEQKQMKYISEIKDSHLKKISEVTMEAVADKEAKRKRDELAESNITSKK